METIRTPEERDAAIVRLRENKNKCRLGTHAYSEINAMIRTIQNGWDEDTVYEEFRDGSDEQDAALVAVDYLKGDCDIEDIVLPEN